MLMDNTVKRILLPAHWDDYIRFKPLCCVDSMPYSRGQCWVLGLMAADESGWIDPDAGFIGYNWPYRFNSIRPTAIKELLGLPDRSRYTYINRHIKTLSRIMIRPKWRARGYASWLIENTLSLVLADYIECLTFTEQIASILLRQGFIQYGRTGGMECDYFLWHNPLHGTKQSLPST